MEKKSIVSFKRLQSVICFLLVWYDFYWEVFVNKRLKPWEAYTNAIDSGFYAFFPLKTKLKSTTYIPKCFKEKQNKTKKQTKTLRPNSLWQLWGLWAWDTKIQIQWGANQWT